jgi:pre-mRNA-splicing factor SYF1
VPAAAGGRVPAAATVHRSVRLWSLYLDLEERCGSLDGCRAAYDRAVDLRVATPAMLLNYAALLEERAHFDAAFAVYETAAGLFVWPALRVVWLTYLDRFVARYGGSKLERLRDIFESCLASAPPEHAAELFVRYARAEEEFGLARQALSVYERACRAVAPADRLAMYRLLARKTEQLSGATRARPVYERGVAALPDEDSRELCLDFAALETRLGEVDRARALYQYGSQFAPPAAQPGYWERWRAFEEAHGNEDTYREMLRLRRSVETAFSQAPPLAAGKREAAGDGDAVQFVPATKRQTV